MAGRGHSGIGIIHAFWRGATPEQTVQDYEALSLAEVYGVIHYYLTHRRTVDAYLKAQGKLDTQLRRSLGAANRQFLADLRRRMDARRRTRNRAA